MKYVLLIHGEEGAWQALSEAERATQYEGYEKLAREMEERGHLRGAEELDAASTGTLVRSRGGETLVADGPFIETKEQLGGYFTVECNLQAALDYAARIPAANGGTVEVRRVVEGPNG